MNLTFIDFIVVAVAMVMGLIKLKYDKRAEKAKPAEKIFTAIIIGIILLILINFTKPYLT